jgi:transcriptional regulator with XRE-family HTH domain
LELGAKIKQLRARAGLTQEQLAERLGLSAQAVSKWETASAMPDITLLPPIAEQFGVSIDELFDLTKVQKLRRIENRMDCEAELPADVFRDYEGFLKERLAESGERGRILSLLGHLYHHRMEADARRVSAYARESIRLAPEKKDCQWLLARAEDAVIWDWNIANHARTIDFYKEVVALDPGEPKSPLPYYYLIDHLIADRRTEEAKAYLEELRKLPAHKPMLARTYEAHIALAEFDERRADAIIEQALRDFAPESGILFEAAQYYAGKCDYERAVELYEASYAADKKPRFIDALQGIAAIREIQGRYAEAAAVYDRILENMHEEWGFTEETVVQEAEQERSRLLQRAKK